MTAAGRAYDYVFVVGIRSNFLGLLPDALRQADARRLSANIVDVHAMLPGVSQYSNDWAGVGLSDRVATISDADALVSFASKHLNASSRVVFLYPPDRNLRRIWKVLQGSGASMGVMLLSPMPTSEQANGEQQRPLLQRVGLSVKSLVKPRPDFVVVSGSVCKKLYGTYFRSLAGVKTINAHSIEYELTLQPVDDGSEFAGRIAFLEQGWFSKPRPPYLNESRYPPLGMSRYRERIQELFHRLERLTGHGVVVCAHPKADRQATKDLFVDRDVVFGRTMSVVKHSSLVVAHNSTSLVYAVIYGKPALLFDCADLRNSVMRDSFASLRKEIPLPVVDLDHQESLDADILRLPDRKLYERFVSRYITQDPERTHSIWSVLFDELQSTT